MLLQSSGIRSGELPWLLLIIIIKTLSPQLLLLLLLLLLVKLRLSRLSVLSLRLDSSLRVNFCLDGEDENLRVHREELLDGELLHVGRGGQELVVGVLLLLQVDVEAEEQIAVCHVEVR